MNGLNILQQRVCDAIEEKNIDVCQNSKYACDRIFGHPRYNNL